MRPQNCCCDIPSEERLVRHAFTCKPEDEILIDPACINRECESCKGDAGGDFADLSCILCETCVEIGRVGGLPNVEFKKLSKVDRPVSRKEASRTDVDPGYREGARETANEFITQNMTMADFGKHLSEMLPTHLRHHSHSRWQQKDSKDCDFPPSGCLSIKRDFAQNYSFQKPEELQQTYFAPLQMTLEGFAVAYRVEDATDISDEEKKRLLSEFAAANETPCITEFICVVSPDLSHDTAFVQFTTDLILKEYERRIKGLTRATIRSDGCREQYKNRKNLFYVARHADREGFGLEWAFHCSAHGKDLCDAMNGRIKAILHEAEGSRDEHGRRVHDLNSAEEAYEYLKHHLGEWCHGEQQLNAQKTNTSKARSGTRSGVYRYKAMFVGAKDVNRRSVRDCGVVQLHNGKGVVNTHHNFACTTTSNQPDQWTLNVAELSCHSCSCCKSFGIPLATCQNDKLPKRIEVTIKAKVRVESTGAGHTAKIKKEGTVLASRAEPGDYVAVEVEGDSKNAWLFGIVTEKVDVAVCDDCKAKGKGVFCQKAKKEKVAHDGYMGEIWCGDKGLRMNRLSLVMAEGQTAATLRCRETAKVWWDGKWIAPNCFVHEWDVRHIFTDVKQVEGRAKRRRVSQATSEDRPNEHIISSEERDAVLERLVFDRSTPAARNRDEMVGPL